MTHVCEIENRGEKLILVCSSCGDIGQYSLMDGDDPFINAARQGFAHEEVAKSRETS